MLISQILEDKTFANLPFVGVAVSHTYYNAWTWKSRTRMRLRRRNWREQDEWVTELRSGDHCWRLPCLQAGLESSRWTDTALPARGRQHPRSMVFTRPRTQRDFSQLKLAPTPRNSRKFSHRKNSRNTVKLWTKGRPHISSINISIWTVFVFANSHRRTPLIPKEIYKVSSAHELSRSLITARSTPDAPTGRSPSVTACHFAKALLSLHNNPLLF